VSTPVSAPRPQSAPASRPAYAAASRGYWPSLIAPAHAETFHMLTLPTHRAAPLPERNSTRIFVQAGAFAVPENAQRVRARIAGLGNVEVITTAGHGNALYRVRVGPVASEAAAERLLGRVVDRGYPGARVVAE